MPGLDEGAAEASYAVGPQHFSHRLHTAALEQEAQPDQQRHQRQQREQRRLEPVADAQAFIHQAGAEQIHKITMPGIARPSTPLLNVAMTMPTVNIAQAQPLEPSRSVRTAW